MLPYELLANAREYFSTEYVKIVEICGQEFKTAYESLNVATTKVLIIKKDLSIMATEVQISTKDLLDLLEDPEATNDKDTVEALKIVLADLVKQALKRCAEASEDLKNLATDLSRMSGEMKGFEATIKANKDAKSGWMLS